MTGISTSHPQKATARGPHPGLLATVSLALLLADLMVTAALSGGRGYVPPFASAIDVASYFHGNVPAVRVGAVLQFGSAIPLGIYAATVYARQLRLGVRVPGPVIGFFGGICASMFGMFSGLIGWVLSRPEITTDAALTQALSFLAFATGGVGYVVGSGLLVAGVAVPALLLRFLPSWLAGSGLVLAALSELSFLSLVLEPLQFLLPVGRFGGLLWLIAAGILLPHNRAAANAETRP